MRRWELRPTVALSKAEAERSSWGFGEISAPNTLRLACVPQLPGRQMG